MAKKIADITVTLYREDDRKLFLKIALASGTHGDESFDLSYSSGGLHLNYRGAYHTVMFNDLVRAACKAIDEAHR